MDEKDEVKWDVIPLPPDVSAMSDEERAAYHQHIEDGTVPVTYMTIEEAKAKYGPSLLRIENVTSD